MKIILTNKTKDTRFSVVDRKTLRVLELLPGEAKELVVDNEEDIKQYRRSYEGLGIDISIKEAPKEEIPDVVVEEPAPAEVKPKRSRKKAEPKVEEPAPAEENPVEEPAPAEETPVNEEEPHEEEAPAE